MQIWNVNHGLDGFKATLEEIPVHAYFVEQGWDLFVSKLCPCCSKNVFSWLVSKLEPKKYEGVFIFSLLNGPPMKYAWKRTKRIVSIPIDYDVAASIDKEFADDMERVAAHIREDSNGA